MTGDRIALAVHDHGGDGPPLILLHGAGRTLADWAAVAPRLTGRHRVLAVDLRGHGLSPAGPWSLARVVEDIEGVLDEYGLPDALPVGHSLGGMIAVRYALDHPEVTPGAANLDGFGWGRPDQYVGLDPAVVAERLVRVRESVRDGLRGGPLPVDGLQNLLARERALSGELGIPYELLEKALLRSVRHTPDGRLESRPLRDDMLAVLAEIDSLDLFDLFARMDRPLLLGRALRPTPPAPGREWFDELTRAYGMGLARDLTALAARRTHVRVVGIDGTHAMLLENPGAVAAAVLAFAAEALTDPASVPFRYALPEPEE
ncbi:MULTISPECIES: alpha/beta fold hydrolase [unclassified Streptomyces]|uniref:alpha/beta fold hydrolase n=1 Tax=unclassified Streptomyces TaxID=2593676 RepID=UPI0011CE98B2|nr:MULTISPECIES: alpha/beta hydrolase [unclassified Streptomyces]TXS71259.1 alpha/beta hydrolase [Streptomyces sp. me109]